MSAFKSAIFVFRKKPAKMPVAFFLLFFLPSNSNTYSDPKGFSVLSRLLQYVYTVREEECDMRSMVKVAAYFSARKKEGKRSAREKSRKNITAKHSSYLQYSHC